MSTGAHGAHDDDLARQAVLELLPFLLSNPPFIPASLKCAALNRRHQYLKLSPEEVEEYLVTDVYPGASTDTAARTVKRLGELKTQVEQLTFGQLEIDYWSIVSRVRYKSPEEGVTMAGVELGNPEQTGSPLLLLLLRLERDDTTNATRYKYDNLQPAGQVPGSWYNTRREAISSASTRTLNQEAKLQAHRQAQESEDCQQPSEYITDAADFWDGFEDSDKEGESPSNPSDADRGIKRPSESVHEYDGNMHGIAVHPAERLSPIHIHQRRTEAGDVEGGLEAIKMILGGAWKLMKGTLMEDGDDLDRTRAAKEEVFMSLVQEAIEECERGTPPRFLPNGMNAL